MGLLKVSGCTWIDCVIDCALKILNLNHIWCHFDMSNVVLFTTHIPSDIDDSVDEGCSWRHLTLLNGSIVLITYHAHMVATFNISILGEFRVKESWTKLFSVEFSYVEQPFGMENGKLFFIRKDGELALFDLSTCIIEELGIKGETFGCRIVVYRENLLPIGGVNK